MSKTVFIDLLTVRAGRTSGVYLEGKVKGERVYMPLTPAGARQLATDLERAAKAVEWLSPAEKPPRR